MTLAQLLTAEEAELVEHYPNRAEHAADWWVHAVGLAFAAIGGAALLFASWARGDLGLATATSAYALCLVVMLACSAAYNLTRPSRARRVLRRLDEAAIFLMIAGSYTPFTTQYFDGWLAFAITGGIWALGLAGVFGKLFLPNISEKAWCVFYVAFGWLAVIIMPPLSVGLPLSAIVLLAAGGLVYTSGVLFFLNHKLPFRRAIWHGFVILGAALHFGAVAFASVLAG